MSATKVVIACLGTRYSYQSQYLFPPRGTNGIVTDKFELAPSEWTQLFLYFPIPDSGLNGETFRLLVEVEELRGQFPGEVATS